MIVPNGGSASRLTLPHRPAALDALIVVPPHLRYVSGPLLGCALLHGASSSAGLRVAQLDLAVRRWADHSRRTGARYEAQGEIRGDHDRPFEADDAWCLSEESHLEQLLGRAPRLVSIHSRPAVSLPYGHETVQAAAERLVRSPDGAWIRRHLIGFPEPRVVGLSVLYAGQVVWAYAVSRVVRMLWPDALVVWGGPHVTALAAQIGEDERYGEAADAFVVGHAERTWVDLLQTVASGNPLPAGAGRAGDGVIARALANSTVAPEFVDLDLYGPRLTLPVQTTIGCAYAKCGFCTYPAVEGQVRDLDFAVLDPVLALAQPIGAVVAVKDSLVLPLRLEAIAARVAGRVQWSACTKLHPGLDRSFLRNLRASGCRTLEIGLETLLPASQRLIRKVQSRDLLRQTLDAAADAGLALVLNYITGLPGEDAAAASAARDELLAQVLARRPDLHAKVEHHVFELDRLAPLAGSDRPERLRVLGSWPWSSVLDWSMSEVRDSAAAPVELGARP